MKTTDIATIYGINERKFRAFLQSGERGTFDAYFPIFGIPSVPDSQVEVAVQAYKDYNISGQDEELELGELSEYDLPAHQLLTERLKTISKKQWTILSNILVLLVIIVVLVINYQHNSSVSDAKGRLEVQINRLSNLETSQFLLDSDKKIIDTKVKKSKQALEKIKYANIDTVDTEIKNINIEISKNNERISANKILYNALKNTIEDSKQKIADKNISQDNKKILESLIEDYGKVLEENEFESMEDASNKLSIKNEEVQKQIDKTEIEKKAAEAAKAEAAKAEAARVEAAKAEAAKAETERKAAEAAQAAEAAKAAQAERANVNHTDANKWAIEDGYTWYTRKGHSTIIPPGGSLPPGYHWQVQ
ncbi:MAG: hypothetical protein LBS41_02785 [Streptococcaceae bacterium]|jgi:hypothetical protein|nr:hypothetical protein [Streptococcaceae bacterium]